MPTEFFCFRCDYCTWTRLELLETGLLPQAKNGRNTNWFRLFYCYNYLKWDNSYHYERKFKVRKVQQNLCSAEKRRNFHFQWERVVQVHVHTATPLPPVHTLWKASDLVQKFGHHKLYQACCVFYSSWAPHKKRKIL